MDTPQVPSHICQASRTKYLLVSKTVQALSVLSFPSTKETDKLYKLNWKTANGAGQQLEAQRDGVVWLGEAKAGCKYCLLLFEIVVVGPLQGKQNQILLRGTQGKHQHGCLSLWHSKFPLDIKKWALGQAAYRESLSFDLKTQLNKPEQADLMLKSALLWAGHLTRHLQRSLSAYFFYWSK